MGDQPSFIEEARREQIIRATIETLDEIGYVNISLAKIAKKAKVSTGLISYHFKDKEDVLNHTLIYLLKKQFEYIQDRVSEKETANDQLITFIDASLAYQVTHRINNIALIEIIFNARTEDNIPYYKLSNDEEDPIYMHLQKILRYGQETNEFSEFDLKNVSIMIQGATAESMLMTDENFDIESYKNDLVYMVTKMVK
ncbi:TetR/AcrR family transcriptional regulator [Tenuibacillus multivorans]|uniref:DNA-binding transcriptional regulator, AcrR family n=1 Tax=Tenuibacillus multivorans TaxID=237069 RepID=A0A1H0FH00_9BACI|nr:TetR/AcrR family transcriptional regulator [Tenuibacillus multivorans]GEL77659.1 TetR family transcriptional regulator [Tenuibacillus multivorans]SDN93864.1 DNA-binding transcriptional regulator, AcrR family [Tenuibacillus multivorans]